jgi:hypothetical protein
VLNDRKPSVPLVIPRSRRPDTELEAKNVWVGERLTQTTANETSRLEHSS